MRAREHHSEVVRRVPRLQFTFVVCIVIIAAAYWVVQVVNGATYRELALNNSLRKHVIGLAVGKGLNRWLSPRQFRNDG